MAEAAGSPVKCQLDVDEENNHVLELMRKVNQMRTEKRKCDLIIKVEGKEIHVHCNVMMAGSGFFDVMFSHDVKENSSGVVEMKDITFYIMQKCIVYIYTGKISITDEECEPLLYAATMMQLTTVCDKIVMFLQSRLNPRSFFNIKNIAVKFNLNGLNETCDEFALENLSLLVKEEEFNQLEKKYIHFLITAKDYDEDSKMALILQWIKSDAQNRRQHLIELVNDLDLGKISWSCGKYITENEQLCFGSPEFMSLMYLGKANLFSEVPTAPLVVRSHQPNSIVVFDKTSKALQAYSPATQSWKKMHLLHEDLLIAIRYTAVVVKQWFFVLLQDKKIYRINILDEEAAWIRMKDMLETHGQYLRAARHDDDIFVVGNKILEKYSTLTNMWEILCRDTPFLEVCEIAVCCGSIYTLGNASKDVHTFSLTERSWSSVPPMHNVRETPAAVTDGDKIYVAGGCGLTSVEVYDTKLEVWTNLPSMQRVHDEFGLFYIGNKLFAVGHRIAPQCIEMYDFKMKRWTVVEDLNGMDIASQASVAAYLPR